MTQPDRQDGDGLSLREHCVRWLRRKRVTAELSTADLKIKAKEFEHNIGADAEQMLSDASQPGEIDGYPHSALVGSATPPASTNGAEGAGPNKIMGIDGSGNPQGRSEPESIASTAPAPPQPAPPVMRERFQYDRPAPDAVRLPEFDDPRVQIVYEMLCDDNLNTPPNPEEHWEGWITRNIVAALSAPVPSPDALRQNADRAHDKMYGFLADPVSSPDGAGELHAALEAARQDIVFAIAFLGRDAGNGPRLAVTIPALNKRLSDADTAIRAVLSPSGAGAAEPVAQPRFFIDHGMIHDRMTGKHVVTDGTPPFEDSIEQVCVLLNSLAAPPVRGDRSILADEYADYSAQCDQVRREMRALILERDDPKLSILYYRAVTLSEHEAARRTLLSLPSAPVSELGDFLCKTCSGTGRAPPSRNLVAAPVSGRDAVIEVPKAALDWLNGEAPDADGKWFGECEPIENAKNKRHKPYWWRSKFRSMIPALSQPARSPKGNADEDRS